MARYSFWCPENDWVLNENDSNDFTMKRIYNYWVDDCEDIQQSVKWIKDMIKKYGGYGYTQHVDRDGSIIEISEIKTSGNNSRFRYNRHL